MTVIEKSYRFQVATAGASAVSGNVDFTETTNVAQVGPVGGQRVDPKESRTASRPWSVDIADVSETITADLADSDGRTDLLRRLCDISVSTDGGSTWTVLATGRVSNIEMVDVAAFRFTVQDERLIERTTEIWTNGNTTTVVPRGIENDFMGLTAKTTNQRINVVEVQSIDSGNNTTTYRCYDFKVPNALFGLLEDDVVDAPAFAAQNFTNLRLNVDGTDRTVSEFDGSRFDHPYKNLEDKTPGESGLTISTIKVSGYQDSGGVGTFYQAYLHMQGANPSQQLPLHIGGQNGVDPFSLVKDIYDNTANALPKAAQDGSNPSTVRYNSNAFSAYDETSNPGGLIDNPRFPKMHFRIKRPENMARWLEDNIYGPLGVTPFVNEDGEVEPVITRMPASDQISDPANLHLFDKTNTSKPHPTWNHDDKELVTVVEFEFQHIVLPSVRRVPVSPGDKPSPQDAFTVFTADTFDLFEEKTTVVQRSHDTVSTLGRQVMPMVVRGLHDAESRKRFADQVSVNIFDRFGDGPVYTKVHGQSDSESVRPGDWVRLDLDSYPSVQNQSRNGTRILQVLSRLDTPAGPDFKLIDAGASLNPLPAPSISAAQNTSNTHHAIDVTIFGLGTGEGYEVHLSENATEPDEKSPEWQFRHARGTANETATISRLPSGKTIWARARATQPGRISSDWATATSATTQSLSAPTGLSATGTAGDSATIAWTNGESDYDVQVSLDSNFRARLGAGVTEYEYTELDASTSYTAGVKHVDDFGGSSTEATTSFTTTATASGAPDMRGIRILVGNEQ